MLELYTSEPNTFFLKPLIALHEKQAAFESRWFDAERFEQFAACRSSGDSRSAAAPRARRPAAAARWHADLELVVHARVHRRGAAGRDAAARRTPGTSIARTPPRNFSARNWARSCPCSGCVKYLAPRLAAHAIAAEVEAAIATIEPRGAPPGLAARCSTAPTLRRYSVTARERLKFPVQRIEKQLAEGPWLAGPRYSASPTSMRSRC